MSYILEITEEARLDIQETVEWYDSRRIGLGDELELLSLLVEKYEQEHYPVGAPNPIEAIMFRLDQRNLKQVDIAPLLGGKTRVSEIFNGKRPLTLKMIILLNRYLGIPFESLISGNRDIKLESEALEKLLSIGTIKEYYSGLKTALLH